VVRKNIQSLNEIYIFVFFIFYFYRTTIKQLLKKKIQQISTQLKKPLQAKK